MATSVNTDETRDHQEVKENTPAAPPTRPSNEYVLNFAFVSFIAFLTVQTGFALIAHSESMLADSEAMSVDALTYLFNLLAERFKEKPYDPENLQLSEERRQYHQELRRLYLELVPPAISVSTLMVVTVYTLQDAWTSLSGFSEAEEDTVSVPIMLIFSAANLLLDVVNVTCFARAGSSFGLNVVGQNLASEPETNNSVGESTRLLPSESSPDEAAQQDNKQTKLVNLNMCSAWTHVCADTLRSLAVLIAAGIAFVVPSVQGSVADSVAAIAVSIIIFGSLFPLLHGLGITGLQIHHLHRNPPLD